MKIVTFDVETIPDESRRDIIRPIILERLQVDKPGLFELMEGVGEQGDPHIGLETEIDRIMSITPEYCKLVCLGYAVNEEMPRIGIVNNIDEAGRGGEPLTETDLLKAFWKLVERADHIIGYNILNFDLQVIRSRSARLGIKNIRPLWDVKPWEPIVIDVYAKRWPSGSKGVQGRKLDQVASVERIPIPQSYQNFLEQGFTGADILPAWQKGDLESIGTHCELDVIMCRELARLWGGVLMPQVFLPWDEWSYEAGQWIGEKPDGW